MERPARFARYAIFAALPILAVGCVPQDRYDDLLTANRSLKEQIASAETERDQAQANLGAVQSQLAETRTSYQSLQTKYGQLKKSVEGMDSMNQEYLQRISQLEMGPLPAEVSTAIEDLARAHPELLTFDPSLGMLRFASDFTFDSGSVAVKSDAASTISELASVLNEPAAQGIEVRVVGHTDNVPIGRPETRRLHPTNLALSVHRAIAVHDVLTGAGVDPKRIQVAGYGEWRPIVPNDPKHGAAANRRVEIFLAPMTDTALSAAPPASKGTTEPASSASAEPMK